MVNANLKSQVTDQRCSAVLSYVITINVPAAVDYDSK